jgi:hypothetical protein
MNNQICDANLDYSDNSWMRTGGIESREKGFLHNNISNEKILSRVGGAMKYRIRIPQKFKIFGNFHSFDCN